MLHSHKRNFPLPTRPCCEVARSSYGGWLRVVLPLILVMLPGGMSCAKNSSFSVAPIAVDRTKEPPHVTVQAPVAAVPNPQNEQLLQESWQAYRERFIQADGRVIDWEGESRTVSEGQAYAMLRAVLIDDPQTFEITLKWAEANLRRSPSTADADGQDHLWAWLWGKRTDGTWGILDANFASDADIDAITALILAANQWNRPDYLELARQKLADLWEQSTAVAAPSGANSSRYLLPGPLAAFQPQSGKIYLNPSYFAPYAFRLFAEVDLARDRDWMQLVDSSYEVLAQTKQLSQNGLPGNWVLLDLATQKIQPTAATGSLSSQYGFDAYRVWWRIAWDAALSNDPRAQQFLQNHLPYLQHLWQTEGRIPAVLSLTGQPLVEYEATSQYAMLYAAWQQLEPETAAAIRNQKLLATYEQGIWDNPDAYYVQNLAWLGLFAIEDVQSIFPQ